MEHLLNYGYYNVIGWNKLGPYTQISGTIYNGLDRSFENLMFLRFDIGSNYHIPDLGDLMAGLNIIYATVASPFIILTPRRNPPLQTASEDEFVYSFSCKTAMFNSLLKQIKNRDKLNSQQLLFELLDVLITTGNNPLNLLVRQIPILETCIDSEAIGDVIIPHRGNNQYLNTALRSSTIHPNLNHYVGIDQVVDNNLQELINRYSTNVRFYKFEPNPVGPYVIRNRLIEQGEHNLKFFYDSDDISCVDRFATLSRFFKDNDSLMCGSHELRLDYITRTIQSIRFPLDVIEALKTGPWHALLHPSSAITKKAFYNCGKLSEERTFANDTKFLLNSFFHIGHIRNVNEFLYIRRKHATSLTNIEATKIGSPIRQELLRSWGTNFELIKMQKIDLKNSNLGFLPTKIDVSLTRL